MSDDNSSWGFTGSSGDSPSFFGSSRGDSNDAQDRGYGKSAELSTFFEKEKIGLAGLLIIVVLSIYPLTTLLFDSDSADSEVADRPTQVRIARPRREVPQRQGFWQKTFCGGGVRRAFLCD